MRMDGQTDGYGWMDGWTDRFKGYRLQNTLDLSEVFK